MEYLKELFKEYDEQLGSDTTDYISQVSKLVNTTEPKLFEKTFRKWLIDAVSNLFESEKNTNPICLVLCGAQGTYKTTFLDSLFDWDFSYVGSFDVREKDCLRMLSDTFVIALDGHYLGTKDNDKDIEILKKGICINQVHSRWPYQKKEVTKPRIANFFTSSNLASKEIYKTDFLVPFDLKESIDMKGIKAINLRKMWAQAYRLQKELSH